MNEKSFESLKDFSKAVLKYIEQNCYDTDSDQYMPFTRFIEPDSYQHSFKRKIINKDFIIKYHTEHIFKLSETKKTINTLLSENIFQCLVQLDDNPFYIEIYLGLTVDLIKFVLDYIERNASFDYDEKAFKKLYLKYEKGWLTDIPKLRAIVPLVDFDSDLDKIELPNNAKLERFDSEEKTELWNSHDLNSIFNINDFNECKFKIECYYELGYDREKEMIKVKENMEKCITAMRLLHEGHFGALGFIQSIKLPKNPHYIPDSINFMDDYNLSTYVDRKIRTLTYEYYFNSKDLKSFNEIFNNLNSKNKLALGLLKFNQAYSRKRTEDTIIDLTIVLESSLLFGTKDELKYRLAIRGATLLKNIRDSEKTYKTLKSLYDVRSNIVHNGKSLFQLIKNEKIEKIDKNEFIPLNFQITREILIEYFKYLNSGTGIQGINNELDDQIIKSLKTNFE